MRILFRGSDEGSILMLAIVAIFLFSLLFLSYVPVVSAKSSLAERKMALIILENERINQEIIRDYDVH